MLIRKLFKPSVIRGIFGVGGGGQVGKKAACDKSSHGTLTWAHTCLPSRPRPVFFAIVSQFSTSSVIVRVRCGSPVLSSCFGTNYFRKMEQLSLISEVIMCQVR